MARSPFSIQLAVSDLGTTEAFYAGILKLPLERAVTPIGAPEHLVLPFDGGGELIFVEESGVARAHPLLEVRLAALPRGVGMTLHLLVEGLGEIFEELVGEEQEILYPLELKPYGSLELWCFDPDGYLLVLEEPCRGEGARGR